MSDARDEYGNYKSGYSYDEAQRAGVTASDSQASAVWKIEQEKSNELGRRLGTMPYESNHSNIKRKAIIRPFILGVFSLVLIAHYTVVFLEYITRTSFWAKYVDGGSVMHDFPQKDLVLFGVICVAAFFLWRLSVKFFKWLCN